jgi:hypothetical protein
VSAIFTDALGGPGSMGEAHRWIGVKLPYARRVHRSDGPIPGPGLPRGAGGGHCWGGAAKVFAWGWVTWLSGAVALGLLAAGLVVACFEGWDGAATACAWGWGFPSACGWHGGQVAAALATLTCCFSAWFSSRNVLNSALKACDAVASCCPWSVPPLLNCHTCPLRSLTA